MEQAKSRGLLANRAHVLFVLGKKFFTVNGRSVFGVVVKLPRSCLVHALVIDASKGRGHVVSDVTAREQ